MRPSRIVVTVLAASILSACSLFPQRASQGDVAACVYVHNAVADRPLVFPDYAFGGGPPIVEGVEDGALRGLLAIAWLEAAGPERDAVLARCRELRAIR